MSKLFNRSPVVIAFFVFIVIAAFRFLCIKNFAVDIFWSDQWDSEIQGIYFKVLDGTLSAKDLWVPGNEHHLVLTKLLNLFSFEISGRQFNQLNALYPQAIVFSLTPAVLAYFMNLHGARPFRTLLLILIFLPVFDYENVYWSYQSQVYFAMLFGVVGAYLASKPKRSLLQIAVVTILAGLSNGAASYIPLLALSATLLTWRRTARPVYESCFYLAFSFLTYKIFTAAAPHHDQFKANSLISLIKSLFKYSAWPHNAGWFLCTLIAFSAIVVAKKIYKEETEVSTLERYGLFLSLWFFLFLASSIYARAGFPELPVRYYAYYLVGYSALLFFNYSYSPRTLAVVLISLSAFYVNEISRDYSQWKNFSAKKAMYRTNFIETLRLARSGPGIHDADIMKNLEKLPLPYAGYPSYEVPYRVIRDPKTVQIFHYLLEEKVDETHFASPEYDTRP